MIAAPEWTALGDLPYAFGGPPLSGRLRATTADFQVDEVLGFEPDGEGEHALLLVRKIGLNTEELARQLARHAGLRPRDVGYCGLKDRNAVTSQWFSLGLAGREEPDWAEFLGDPITTSAILDRIFHHSVIVKIYGPSYRQYQGELLQKKYGKNKEAMENKEEAG